MGKVIAPFAGTPAPGETLADVIEELETLLEAAKSGEIIGLGYFYVDPAKSVHSSWVPGKAPKTLMGYGGSCLHFRIMLAASTADD